MSRIPAAVALLALTAWVGALWAIGYLAAPVLFYSQPDRMLAGMLAGDMFSRVAWLGIACGGILTLYLLKTSGKAAWRQASLRLVTVMLLVTLLNHFGLQAMMNTLKAEVAPAEVMHSTLAARFGMLHGISSLLYMLESLLGAWLVVVWRGR